MRLFLALTLIPFAAFANPLEPDFDKIFTDNADKLVEKNGGTSLKMETNILISKNSEGEYLALDGSTHDAVGCILRLTLQSMIVGKLCPESITPEQSTMLNENVNSIALFYAENNVPTHPLGEVQTEIDKALGALGKRLQNLECKAVEITRFKNFLGTLTGEEMQQKLNASLSTPRLPVVEPCL
jgi:hypothetical protein